MISTLAMILIILGCVGAPFAIPILVIKLVTRPSKRSVDSYYWSAYQK